MHKGKTLGRGHYYSLTKRGNEAWYLCNDSEIRRYLNETDELKEVMRKYQKKVYILVYQKA